jgi:hypothetical protein
MTNGSRLLGRLALLLVVLIGVEIAVIGGVATTLHHSGYGQGPVAFVVNGIHAVTKVALTAADVAGKLLSLLVPEAQGQDPHGTGILLPAAASAGGAHSGCNRAGEDCCRPDPPHTVVQADPDRCGGVENRSI